MYTEKQKEFLRLFKQGRLQRINILQGSVRSGKTWISLVLWGLWLATMPKDGRYLMAAKTLTSLRRNCLDVLLELFGKKHFSYSIPAKRAVLFGRYMDLEGASDARAESKIRGVTLQGAYCDELTLFPETFFAMLLSRLSAPGAKLIGTTNPDNPGHWLKVKYLDRKSELDLLDIFFGLDDNTFLDKDFKDNIKRENIGVFYKRFVLGQWVPAEGAIYQAFADEKEKHFTDKPEYDFIQVGVDFGGNKSAFAFVACGLKSNFSALTALRSERHPAKGVTPEHMYSLLADFLARVERDYGAVDIIYADSAEQTMINGMQARLAQPVRNSVKNPIIDRIRATTSLMARGRFSYTKDCQTLVDALCNAVYDSKSLADKRLDDGTSDIDTLDAFEYSWERYIRGYAGD